MRSADPTPLPEVLPIFPLPGVLLLPRGRLPLNIFEPRYLTMTADALGEGRMIGMVQPVHPEPDPVSDTAAIYSTGCAGRIVTFAETDDGRYLITLAGISRFRVVRELEIQRGYRRVMARYDEFRRDLEEESGGAADRRRLDAAVRAYFELRDIDADWRGLAGAPDHVVVTSLAMICPFGPREKQALLECAGVAERSTLLTALMEMAVHESEDADLAAKAH